MAFHDELVEVRGRDRVHHLQGEVVDDEQVDAGQPADLRGQRAVQPGGLQGAEQLVGAVERDAGPAADGDVSQGGGEVGLADPDRAEDQGAAGDLEQPQRGELGPDRAVVAGTAVGVEGLQAHRGVQPGRAGPQLGAGAVPAGGLIGQHQGEELGVAQPVRRCQGEPFGQGVHRLAELQPAQQRGQVRVQRCPQRRARARVGAAGRRAHQALPEVPPGCC